MTHKSLSFILYIITEEERCRFRIRVEFSVAVQIISVIIIHYILTIIMVYIYIYVYTPKHIYKKGKDKKVFVYLNKWIKGVNNSLISYYI